MRPNRSTPNFLYIWQTGEDIHLVPGLKTKFKKRVVSEFVKFERVRSLYCRSVVFELK